MDRNEIKNLYERYAAMVYRRCLTLLMNEEKALEAMQDVFLKLIDKKNKLETIAPSSLLYTISTNHCLNIIKKGSIPIYKDEKETFLESEAIISKDLIMKIFKNEKPKVFNIAVMYFLDGMTLEELSAETRMSVSGVRKILGKVKIKAEKYRKEDLWKELQTGNLKDIY